MNVVSVTQDQNGVLRIFFDKDKNEISMGQIGGPIVAIDLAFALDAARQIFDGIPEFDFSASTTPPAVVREAVTQFAEIIAAAYFVPKDEQPRKMMN